MHGLAWANAPAQAHTSSRTSWTPHPGATSFGGDAATPTGCPVLPVVPADQWFQFRGSEGSGLEEKNARLKRVIQHQARTAEGARVGEAST